MSSWQGKSKELRWGTASLDTENAGLSPAYFLLRFVVFYFPVLPEGFFGTYYRLYRRKLGFGTRQIAALSLPELLPAGAGLIDKVVMMAGSRTNSVLISTEENLPGHRTTEKRAVSC